MRQLLEAWVTNERRLECLHQNKRAIAREWHKQGVDVVSLKWLSGLNGR